MPTPRADAIEDHIARPLGIDVVAAAAGILRVAHANIVRGIRVVSVERGHDPRQCTLVPFGGAGPMHGTPVARELQHPAGRRAAGSGHPVRARPAACRSAPRPGRDPHFPLRAPTTQARAAAIARRLSRCRRSPARAPTGVPADKRRSRCASRPATWARATSCRLPSIIATRAPGRLADDFHAAHRAQVRPRRPRGADRDRRLRRHRHRQGRHARIADARAREAPTPPAEARDRQPRDVFFEGRDPARPAAGPPAPVFARDKLLAGNEIAGPAVIEELSATTVLYPGDRAERACQRRAAGGVRAHDGCTGARSIRSRSRCCATRSRRRRRRWAAC